MTGFVMYILSFPLISLYLAWAFLSDKTLVSAGITYYPSKVFVTFLPAYLMLVVFVIALAYAGINMLTSPKHDSLAILCDAYSKYNDDVKPLSNSSGDGASHENGRVSFAESVTEIYDIDVGVINQYVLSKRLQEIE